MIFLIPERPNIGLVEVKPLSTLLFGKGEQGGPRITMDKYVGSSHRPAKGSENKPPDSGRIRASDENMAL